MHDQHRHRHQRGYLYQRKQVWYLRYSAFGAQKAQRLGRVPEDFPSKSALRGYVEEFLKPFNESEGGSLTLRQLVDRKYLPFARQQLRPSTVYGYRVLWRCYLREQADIELRSIRTRDVERLLAAIAQDHHLSATTLSHIKAFLSGALRYAKRQGFLARENPVRDAVLPKGKPPKDTYAYSLEEIQQMLEIFDEPAVTVIATAAFSGLRRGELQALRWQDYEPEGKSAARVLPPDAQAAKAAQAAGAQLSVSRSVWRGRAGEPKTKKSRAAVPVIAPLAERLNRMRQRSGNPGSDSLIFPFSLDTLARDVIAPRLRSQGLQWHGWHAFRRGLATVLNRLGVPDVVIQRILRHANVKVTQDCYIKAEDREVEAAMRKLAAASE